MFKCQLLTSHSKDCISIVITKLKLGSVYLCIHFQQCGLYLLQWVFLLFFYIKIPHLHLWVDHKIIEIFVF